MENESTPEEGTKNKQTTVAMKREYTFYFLKKKKNPHHCIHNVIT